MKNTNILAIALLIVGLGIGFFVGMHYQNGLLFHRGQFLQPGQVNIQYPGRRFGGANRNNGFVAGEIISVDNKSITVKFPNGSSKIILLSGQTQIDKTEAAPKSDLKVEEKVAVFGSVNPDGSVNAQNIQLNPQIRLGGTPSASPRY